MKSTNHTVPLVSIIIPTYNKVQLAIETFKSIVNQSYTNWECIVVDDGSSLKDFKVLDDYVSSNEKFSLYKRSLQSKKGANACRNYGLSIAKGTYIQFFDSDDLMLKDCLKGRVEAIEKSKLDLVIFSMGIYNKNGFISDDKPDVIVNDWESALNAFIGKGRVPWNLQRALYQTELIKDKLSFNEDLSRFQDVEFNIKLLSRLQPKFMIFTKVDCVYRRASSNNPRAKEFNQNVFNSIPVFLDSIHLEMPLEILVKNRENLQQWLFSLIGLYSNQNIILEQLVLVFKTAKKHNIISSKQVVVLRLLFFSKTKLKDIKGQSKFIKFLKRAYVK